MKRFPTGADRQPRKDLRTNVKMKTRIELDGSGKEGKEAEDYVEHGSRGGR
jgi:hypothetical protein